MERTPAEWDEGLAPQLKLEEGRATHLCFHQGPQPDSPTVTFKSPPASGLEGTPKLPQYFALVLSESLRSFFTSMNSSAFILGGDHQSTSSYVVASIYYAYSIVIWWIWKVHAGNSFNSSLTTSFKHVLEGSPLLILEQGFRLVINSGPSQQTYLGLTSMQMHVCEASLWSLRSLKLKKTGASSCSTTLI